MSKTSKVVVWHDAPAGALQLSYDRPYEVLNRGEKTFKLRIRGKTVNVSTDRFKPVYDLTEQTTTENTIREAAEEVIPEAIGTRSGRQTRLPVRFAPQ